MINSITFENFRGLKRLELPELSQITLLTGRNNAGKSSILEGVFLFMGHTDGDSFRKICVFRGLPTSLQPSILWNPAFYGLNTDNSIHFTVKLDGESSDLRYERDDNYIPASIDTRNQITFNQFTASTRSTYTMKFHYEQGKYTEDGSISMNDKGILTTVNTNQHNNNVHFLPVARYIGDALRDDVSITSSIIEWIGDLEMKGEKHRIVDVLKIIEPDLSDLLVISNHGQIQLFVKILDQPMPIKLAGDGLYRLLYILLAILEKPNSILLIDEVGTGFHYSMLETLWKIVATAAKESGCQVIATTHSYECIQSAISGITDAGMDDKFCMYRVERKEGINRAFRYDGELTRFAVATNMEVR